jgi:ABC-type antimicrobial peptide transport system permease subunit
VYGVVSYSVSLRTREIGIRGALGATRTEIARLVFREVFVVAGAGLALGIALAVAAGRAIRSLLFETAPTDPMTYLGVVAVLGLSAALAGYLPVRRALAVDPSIALRYD